MIVYDNMIVNMIQVFFEGPTACQYFSLVNILVLSMKTFLSSKIYFELVIVLSLLWNKGHKQCSLINEWTHLMRSVKTVTKMKIGRSMMGNMMVLMTQMLTTIRKKVSRTLRWWGTTVSISSWYLEKHFRICPVGVDSKKLIGHAMIWGRHQPISSQWQTRLPVYIT